MKKILVIFLCLFLTLSVSAQDGDFELTGMNQQGLFNTISSIKGILENQCLDSAGLVIGGTSVEKVAVGATFEYTIDGTFCSKAPAEVAFTATTHDVTSPAGATKEAYYVLSINAAGTITITKGATALETYGDFPNFADLPENIAVLGYVKVIVNAGQTFDATTTSLANGTVFKSVTYVNTSFLKKYIGAKTPKITVDFLQK